MTSSPDDPMRRQDPVLHGEPASQVGDADPRIDSLLRDVPRRGTRQQDLALLFSDEAIDRILRDVPCRMTSVQPSAADRGRRVPVDLAALATRFDPQAGDPSAKAVSLSDTIGLADNISSRRRRLVRTAVRVARDLVSVAVVLSVVVATFSASVFTSRWLAEPRYRVARTSTGSGVRGREGFSRGAETAVSEPATDGRSTGSDDRIAVHSPVGSPTGPDIPRAGDPGSTGKPSAETSPLHRGLDARRIASQGGSSPNGVSERHVAERPDSEAVVSQPEVRAAPLLGLEGGGLRRPQARPASESLQVFAVRPSVGRAVPSHRGYDLAFEMTSGEGPFIDPSLNTALSVDQPPLSRRTDSFDRIEHLMSAEGVRRDRFRQAVADMRVEEVLAALPSPVGPDRLARPIPTVRLAGFPSISGRPAARLLEVSVAAPWTSERPSGDLLFVLDASAAAGAEEAWPAVCRGVEEAIHRLDPSASITIVIFAERPEVIVQNAEPRDLVAVRRRLAEIRPRGGGDLHGCLAMVRGLVAERNASARCVVVGHAGSIARAERDGDPTLAAWRRSQQMAREAGGSTGDDSSGSVGLRADAGIEPVVEVVEIDTVSGVAGESAGRIGVSLIDGVGLDSMLIRRSIVVAALGDRATPNLEGCRLEVAFDPVHVAAYRLVGHRRQVVDMASARSSAIDLADGECVRAVYEVVLRQRNPQPGTSASPVKETLVVKATCRYRRRGEAAESRVVAGISASQIAVDPEIEDRLGQAVWLSVAVAEQAAGSAHIESLQRLREALRQSFERVGNASAGSSADDPPAETLSFLRQLHAIWTQL